MVEHNNKFTAPCQERIDAAFNRYLILGKFYEIQLVAPGSTDQVVYHLYTSPNLEPERAVKLTIERVRGGKAKVTWDESHRTYDERQHPDAVKTREVGRQTDKLTHVLPCGARTSDAALIKLASEAQGKAVHKVFKYVFYGEVVA